MNRRMKLAATGLAVGLTAAAALPLAAHASPDTVVSRSYPWTSDRLTLQVPADVTYHPGPTWHVTLRAPERTLRELVVTDGLIKAKPHSCFSLIPFCISFGTSVEDTVHVDITGPALRRVKVDGSAKIHLDQVHQDRLTLRIDGSARVRGSGSVNDLAVVIDGSGSVHLGQLTEQRARVEINGAGRVAVAPTESVSVHIHGAGDVRLHSNPPQVSSHIEGAGEVTRVTSG